MKQKFFYTWSKQENHFRPNINEATGVYYVEKSGKKILDLSSTSFQASLGHCHPQITQAICQTAKQLSCSMPKFDFDLKDEVSELLEDYFFDKEGRFFFGCSGSEAIENAIKMAREFTGRKIIIGQERSYHGATFGAMSVSDDLRLKSHMKDHHSAFIKHGCDDPDFELGKKQLEDLGVQNIACICIEIISGTNGVELNDQDYLKKLDQFCKDNGILLIVDEILTGFHRCQAPMAFHQFEIEPDFVTMGKAITAGHYPLSALWANSKVVDFYDQHPYMGGLTHYAHPISLSATKASLLLYKEKNIQDNIKLLEKTFSSELQELHHSSSYSFVKEIRHHGLLASIECEKPISKDLFTFLWNDVKTPCVVSSRDHRIVLAPAFIMTTKELQEGMKGIKQWLQQQSK